MDFSPLFQSSKTNQFDKKHDCQSDCNLFEQCKRNYVQGAVIRCMFFGNKKNFGNITKN